MRVRLLGGFEVEGLAERDLGSRKGRTLLKVLAMASGRPVSIDRLAEILWGDDQPARPSAQIGVLVARLRGVLGADRIGRSDAGYALDVDWLDIAEVRGLAAAATAAYADGRGGATRAAADAALTLVRGPLLPDEDGEWVEVERAAVGSLVAGILRLAVDGAVATGDHGTASMLAEQALLNDPYDEVMLRSLMEAHLAAGRPASALAAYARVRARLSEDLGVSPTVRTEALHEQALAAADGEAPAAVATRPGVAGLVGRARELSELDAALSSAADGEVALVLVEGEAGIGKTTLVQRWSRLVEGATVVLRGRCDELGQDLPLQPVTDALADHLRARGPERAAALVGDDAAALAPLLGPLTGPGATVVADPAMARNRFFTALADVIERAGDGQPTTLIIEDLHLAGESTLAWLRFLQRRGRRTTVVVTTRPGGGRRLDPTRLIRVGPLDHAAVVELVGAERSAALYERSGGHPLLLTALAGSRDDEALTTLSEAVAARVDALGDDVGATLRVAAVLGPDCDLDLVAQIADTPTVEVLTHLEAAAQAGLLVERGSRFAFRHQMVREALEAATGAFRRSFVHRQAARALAARSQADPLAVALHARAGGDTVLAASAYVAAAAAAEARFDLGAAEAHLAAALDLAPTPEAYAARARVRMSRLDLEPAEKDAAQAIALGGGAAALEVAGWVAYYQRRYDDARAYADSAVARATDEAVRVSALALAGRIRHGAGDLAGAVEHLSAVRGGPPSVRGVAEVWLAQARLHQGRPTDALAAMAGPMVDPDSLAHSWAPLHLRFNRVLALGQLGRVADALRVADDLDVVVAREGAIGARFVGPAANAGAWVLRWSGRDDEADERNRRALEATGGDAGPSADGLAESHYVALLDLADGRLLRGDAGGAAELVTRLSPVDAWGGTMAWHQRHRLGLLRARLALAGGAADEATALATAVAVDAARRGAERYELLARAIVGLADPSIPAEQLAPVVEGLGRCAGLDGWPLVAALASARRSDTWRDEARSRATAVVAGAGSFGDSAGRFVDAVLSV